jgi:hypothetical protein
MIENEAASAKEKISVNMRFYSFLSIFLLGRSSFILYHLVNRKLNIRE